MTVQDAATTVGPKASDGSGGPPGRPNMLSHVAFISADTSATVDFYADLLGMELVNAVLDDSIPSTGEPIPYFHSFFRMADGSTIAFFEAPELPPPSPDSHPAYDTFQHLAMQVEHRRRGRRAGTRGCAPTASRCSARSTTRSSTASTSTTPTASASRSPTPTDPTVERQRRGGPGVAGRLGAGEGRGPGHRARHGHGARRAHPPSAATVDHRPRR